MTSPHLRLVAALLAGLILNGLNHSPRGQDLKPISLTVEQMKAIVAGKIALLRSEVRWLELAHPTDFKEVELLQNIAELSVQVSQSPSCEATPGGSAQGIADVQTDTLFGAGASRYGAAGFRVVCVP